MDKTKLDELPPKYQELYSVLRHGSENALSSTELEQITGIPTRDIRNITADLIIKSGCLIGANRFKPYGYFIIETEDELHSTLRALNNELQGIHDRHQALQKNFYKENGRSGDNGQKK
jgi:hypothetical protein